MNARHRHDIRLAQRRRRRDLEPTARQLASEQLYRRLVNRHYFNAARHIALYLSNDGEIDPWPVIEFAWRTARNVYLPVVTNHHQMEFAPFFPDTALTVNRYGIEEPAVHADQYFSARHLDLVLMPVVAFDSRAHRIGMGGGYYDRRFGFLRQRSVWLHPRLIGLAYEFQKVDNIDPAPWDVSAWRIVTDQGSYPAVERY